MPIASDNSARPPVRLGIIGTGLAAKKLHWPALSLMPNMYSVVGFANRTRSTAEEFASLAGLSMDDYFADYRALIDRSDVEAVLVGVPITSLLAVTRECLEAGKHVIAEKPPGGSEAEAKDFAALVDRYPRQKTLMAEQCFYQDDLRFARSLIDAGAIGDPRLLIQRTLKGELPVPGSFASTPWRYRPEYPGGSLLDGGVHPIAAFRLLLGDVTSICARTEWLNSTISAPSTVAMTFGFANGGTGDFVYASLDNPFFREMTDTRILGTTGALEIGRHIVRHIHADGSMDQHDFAGSNSFYNEFVNFFEALAYDAPIVGTVAQSVKNMIIVLRALQSAESNQVIETSGEEWNQPPTGVALWRRYGAEGLFDGLPTRLTSRRVLREGGVVAA